QGQRLRSARLADAPRRQPPRHASPRRQQNAARVYLPQAVLRRLAAWLRVCGFACGYLVLMRPSVVQPSVFWPMPMKDWASLSIASEARGALGYFLITSAKARAAGA